MNQAYNYQERQPGNQPASGNTNSRKFITAKEVKRKFEGNCRYCNIVGHRWVECRRRLRDEANDTHTKTQQRPQPKSNNGQQHQTDKARYNPKLVCQICGKVGHSVRDCRDIILGASAYGNVPYNKQSTTENREFRRDFKQSYNRNQPMSQATPEITQTTKTEDDNDCYNMEYNDESDSNPKNM